MQLFPVSHQYHRDPKWKRAWDPRGLCVHGIWWKGQKYLVWFGGIYFLKDECLFVAHIQIYNHSCMGKLYPFLHCNFNILLHSHILTVEPLSDGIHLKRSISNPWVIHQRAWFAQLGDLPCAAGLVEPLFSVRNECVPPRLAERRTRDIFQMTRGAHALK